jgi:ABC-2 type transport system ATP-binding protein
MMNTLIETHGLGKAFSGGAKKFALRELNLHVNQGEIFGYLGPNGAGKTTTIKLLLDLIRPDSGRASLFGMDSRADSVAIRGRVGYLPGDLALWNGMTGEAVIRYFARVRGADTTAFAAELARRLSFDPTKRIRSYSTGNRRKLGLILAMMHRPELLILDEPTNGLDPLVQQTFNELMHEARASGQTVFLSSHVLSEVQAICDRVGILRDGRLLSMQPVSSLTRAGFRNVTLTLREPAPAGTLAGVPNVEALAVQANTVQFRLTGDFDPVLRALNGAYVRDVQVKEPSLEEIFLTYYSDAPAAMAGEGR